MSIYVHRWFRYDKCVNIELLRYTPSKIDFNDTKRWVYVSRHLCVLPSMCYDWLSAAVISVPLISSIRIYSELGSFWVCFWGAWSPYFVDAAWIDVVAHCFFRFFFEIFSLALYNFGAAFKMLFTLANAGQQVWFFFLARSVSLYGSSCLCTTPP